jgi:hypothetical protein
MSGRGSEDVPPVEGRGRRLTNVAGVGELEGGNAAAERIGRRWKQSVVRPNEEVVASGDNGNPSTIGPHARVDHGEMYRAFGRRNHALGEYRRARAYPAHPVSEIDDTHVGCDPRDDQMADTDVLVGRPVIAGEGDQRMERSDSQERR